MDNRAVEVGDIFREYARPIISESEYHFDAPIDNIRWAFALIEGPLVQWEELLYQVAFLSDEAFVRGANSAKVAIANCVLRYSIELLSNVSYVLDSEGEERMKRVLAWIRSRSDFFRAEYHFGEHLVKDGAATKTNSGNVEKTKLILQEEESEYSKLTDLRNYDPFNKTIFEKLNSVPVRDRTKMIVVYRYATIQTHAYYNSIYAQSLPDHPMTAMIECTTLILDVTASSLGLGVNHHECGRKIADLYADAS